MSRYVVELAGPAGAGKTTLARALQAADPLATTVGVQVGSVGIGAGIASSAPHLLAARMSARGRWWTREELRALAYLAAWRRAVQRGHVADGLLVLDHGPVFRLARLLAFGPPMVSARPFHERWVGLAQDWGGLLDLVAWIDASDDVLLRRVARRAQGHRIRGMDQESATAFLARYRASYRTTLDVVCGAGARLVELDSSSGPPEHLVAAIRRAVPWPHTQPSVQA